MTKPRWLEIAEGEIGQKEVVGGENARILEYHSTTTLHANEDEVPWCSSFVNWCLKQAGIEGTNNALAKSWMTWGIGIEIPTVGCICVIHKKSQTGLDMSTGSSTGYHVAFWLMEKDGRVHLLGGNQSDQVKMSSFGLGTYEIVAYRVPIQYT
jgi:uncharacterized protein (TIGR02594 family)